MNASSKEVYLEKLVLWLPDSGIERELSNGKGFFISRGTPVRLPDNTVVDALDWLSSEGIEDGDCIAGHNIRHSPSNEQWGEKLTFFKVEPIEVPDFSRAQHNMPSDLDDDIPF